MKVLKIFAGFAMASFFLFTSNALAANRGNLQLFENVVVNGTQLNAGHYKVEWNDASADKTTEVKILKGNDVVATAAARIVNSTTPQNNDGYTISKTKNGKEALTEVFFSGKDWTLELRHPGAMNSSGPPSPSGH